jgi:hypothetical protein
LIGPNLGCDLLLHIIFLDYASSRSVTLTVGFKPVAPLVRNAKLKPKFKVPNDLVVAVLLTFEIGVALKRGR